MLRALAVLLVVGYHSWPTGCTAASSASTSPSSSRLPDPSHLHREGQTRDSAPQDAASTVQHFWSLPVEEQFYLVWPELILLLPACADPGAPGRPGAQRPL